MHSTRSATAISQLQAPAHTRIPLSVTLRSKSKATALMVQTPHALQPQQRLYIRRVEHLAERGRGDDDLGVGHAYPRSGFVRLPQKTIPNCVRANDRHGSSSLSRARGRIALT